VAQATTDDRCLDPRPVRVSDDDDDENSTQNEQHSGETTFPEISLLATTGKS
jgi:hypothetical protein